MAATTFNLFLSLALVIGVLLHIGNMVYFRSKGKTIIGNSYKHGSVEYGRLKKLSNLRGLVIAVVIGLIFIANLAKNIYRIAHLTDRGYVHFILIFGPVFILIISIVAVASFRNQYGNNARNDRH